jgi:hypothetical protein
MSSPIILPSAIPRPLKHAAATIVYQCLCAIFNQLRDISPLFILSHQRSGSTLLSHLLIQHPEINGIGETHSHYSGCNPLPVLALKIIYFSKHIKPGSKYCLDKILIDNHIQGSAVLRNKALRVMLFLRTGESTVSSLQKLFAVSRQEAVRYYLSRLDSLLGYAKVMNESGVRFSVLTYEDLLSNPTSSLVQIQSYLGLASPLRSQYALQPFSGVPVFGDPTELIKSGRIEQNKLQCELAASNGRLHDNYISAVSELRKMAAL